MSATKPRPARPPAPPLPAFESLDRTHAEMLQVLERFDRLLAGLEAGGAGAAARSEAALIHAFFDGTARQHHADEDRLVFPQLLGDGEDGELQQHVRRLQQDHGWIEEDWRTLAPQLEAVAAGYDWYDLAMLRAALPVFAALLREHIALEESLIYPEAKRRGALPGAA